MCDFSKYVVKDNITIREALIALNNLTNDVLVLFVVDGQDHLVGSLTDGDIRRKLIDGVNISEKVSVVMNSNFRFVYENAFCVETLKELKATGITLLPILTEDKKIVKVYNLKKKKSILPLDAVLMAGGKGERLRPLTEQIPKPLLKVGDKAIIDYNIDNLISYGVSHINVTVNYLGEQLERHFEQLREGVKVNCIREPQYLGTIGSIKFIDTFYNDTILLMNSDLFTNINFEDFFLHFLQNEADMSVAAIPYSVSVPYGIFELEERTIKGVREKPTYNYYANSGIYLIKRELLSLIPEGVFFNATDFMEKLIEMCIRDRHYIDYNLFLKDLYVVQETSCSIDKTGNLYVLLTTVNKEDFFQTNRWGTPSSRLMYMVCDPQHNILKLEPVLSEDNELTWLPNLGKSNQENQFFIFMQGNNASDNLEKVKNKLWFGWIGWE